MGTPKLDGLLPWKNPSMDKNWGSPYFRTPPCLENPQNDAEERLLKMISMIFARCFRDFIFSTYDLGLP